MDEQAAAEIRLKAWMELDASKGWKNLNGQPLTFQERLLAAHKIAQWAMTGDLQYHGKLPTEADNG